ELVEQELQSLRRQPGKRREMAEEVFELAMLDLELEINADVGALLQERLENGLVQAQRRHVARSTDGGRSGGMLEKAHLAEAVPRAQHAQGDLFALLGPLDDPRAAEDQNVEGVGGVSLFDDRVAEGEGNRDEAVHDERASARGQEPQDREALEKVAFVHDARCELSHSSRRRRGGRVLPPATSRAALRPNVALSRGMVPPRAREAFVRRHPPSHFRSIRWDVSAATRRLPQKTMSEGAGQKGCLTEPSRRLSDQRGPGSDSWRPGPSVSPREAPRRRAAREQRAERSQLNPFVPTDAGLRLVFGDSRNE